MGEMRICIPIRENSWKNLKRKLAAAKKYADLIEIWLGNQKLDFRELIKIAGKPIIAVVRGRAERGSFMGAETERIDLLKKALHAGAKFVDIDIQTAPRLIRELSKTCRDNNTKLIISKHFWNLTPGLSELLEISKRAEALGADIVKIATFVKKWEDNTILFELTRRLTQQKKQCIIVGMGPRGRISRIGCPLLGSYLTYVALDEKSKTAIGQFTLKEICHYKLEL